MGAAMIDAVHYSFGVRHRGRDLVGNCDGVGVIINEVATSMRFGTLHIVRIHLRHVVISIIQISVDGRSHCLRLRLECRSSCGVSYACLGIGKLVQKAHHHSI